VKDPPLGESGLNLAFFNIRATRELLVLGKEGLKPFKVILDESNDLTVSVSVYSGLSFRAFREDCLEYWEFQFQFQRYPYSPCGIFLWRLSRSHCRWRPCRLDTPSFASVHSGALSTCSSISMKRRCLELCEVFLSRPLRLIPSESLLACLTCVFAVSILDVSVQ
jgi:hypothetical protein